MMDTFFELMRRGVLNEPSVREAMFQQLLFHARTTALSCNYVLLCSGPKPANIVAPVTTDSCRANRLSIALALAATRSKRQIPK
jgi:hypothetical protein